MPRRMIPVVTLFTAAVAAGCAPQQPDRRGVAPGETLLQVSATGRAEARPTEARFSAGVSSIAASASAASEANNRKMTAVVAALRSLGVEAKDIQTRQLTISRIGYGPNRNGFEANNVVEVRLRAIDKAGQVIGSASAAGANILSGPDLRVGDPDAASNAAHAAAYKAARKRAEVYAQAAGMKVARILSIRDGGAYAPPITYETSDARLVAPQTVSAPPPPPVYGGTNQAQVAVAVDFALAPAR